MCGRRPKYNPENFKREALMGTSRRHAGWRFMLLIVVLATIVTHHAGARQPPRTGSDWSLNATVIESCSCPMFCQCYFNSVPAAHNSPDGHGGTTRFCRFNRALTVN